MKRVLKLLAIFLIFLGKYEDVFVCCNGKFPNPFTDVCWKCLFPLSIGGVNVAGTRDPDTPLDIICHNGIKVGIPITFWEPTRLVWALEALILGALFQVFMGLLEQEFLKPL